MSERLSFQDVLDLCVQDVVAGVATVDQCLVRYPEHRARLEPALRTAAALTSLPRPEERAPTPERREAFMALVRETPQDPPRRRLGGLRRPAVPRLPSFREWGGGWGPRAFALRAVPAGVVALLAVVLVFSRGATPAAATTLTVFTGQVEQQVSGAWQPVEDGAALYEGLAVRTLSGAHALLTFPDGSTAALDPETQVWLRQVHVDGHRNIELEQATGRLWNDVVAAVGGDTGTYRVRTPHATVEAYGTVFETVVAAQTSVSTVDGLVRVISEGGSVDVQTGEVVRASAQEIASPEPILFVGEITVRAPMAAALTSRDGGAATGLLPNGVVFRQVPGVTTTGPGVWPQHMFVGDITPDVYTLWLRRYADGDGLVVVETQDDRLNIPVAANVTTARVLIAIDIVDGGVFMRSLGTELETVPEAEVPRPRVVQSDRTRGAVGLASARAEATDSPTVAATPEATPTATPTATPDRGRGPRATETPAPTSMVTWQLELHSALDHARRTQDNSRLAAVLERTLDAGDRQVQERLDTLAEVVQDPEGRVRVTAVLLLNVSPEVSGALAERVQRLGNSSTGRALQGGLHELWDALEHRDGESRGNRGDQGRNPTRATATPERTETPTATPTPDRGRDRDDDRGRGSDRDDRDDRGDRGRDRGNDRDDDRSDDRNDDRRGGRDDGRRGGGFLNELLERWRERLRDRR